MPAAVVRTWPLTHDTSEYTASYAPTDRAKCKKCREPIAKGSVRLSRDIPAGWTGDLGAVAAHYHRACGLKVVENMRCASPNTGRTFSSKVPVLRGVGTLRARDARALSKAFDAAKATFLKKCAGRDSG